ncbi:MAG: hypothetical protein QXL29_07560 [Zestosphaera sp.]
MDGLPSFSDLLWFFFIIWIFVSFMYPQLRYSSLRNARVSIIRSLESYYNTKVITLIHRHERITLFGILLYKFINIEDYEEILRAIRSTPPDRSIMLIIHTPGGLMLAASQIALALKRHASKKIVVVPH